MGTMKSRSFASLRMTTVGLLIAAAAGAQAPDTSVHLSLTLDHADWMYRAGDTARYHVSLTRGGRPIAGVPVRVALGQERMRTLRTDTLDTSGGERVVTGT